MKRVLMVCPYFPPRGDIAVKRSLRFVRHLGAAGWEPRVLSLPNGGGGARDDSLLEALPPGLVVDYGAPLSPPRPAAGGAPARPGSLWQRAERAYYAKLQPRLLRWLPCDRFSLRWQDTARRGLDMLTAHGADAIYASSEPTSALPLAAWLGARAGLPVVLDLRDPWTLEPMSFAQKPAPTRAAEEQLERWSFQRAARVILNTERCRDAYRAKYPALAEKLVALRSGVDRGLFVDAPPLDYAGFTLVHFGNLYRHRGIVPLLRAMAALRPTGEAPRLVCFGSVRAEDRAAADALGVGDLVEARAPVPYPESLGALRGAGALLLTQPPQTQLQIPGKLYDYLCAGRPIVALSNNPEIDAVIEEAGSGYSLRPEDEAGLLAALRALARGEAPGPRDPRALARYEAAFQARQLAAWLDEAARPRA